MKIVKSADHYTETALDEIKLLKCVCYKAQASKDESGHQLFVEYCRCETQTLMILISAEPFSY